MARDSSRTKNRSRPDNTAVNLPSSQAYVILDSDSDSDRRKEKGWPQPRANARANHSDVISISSDEEDSSNSRKDDHEKVDGEKHQDIGNVIIDQQSTSIPSPEPILVSSPLAGRTVLEPVMGISTDLDNAVLSTLKPQLGIQSEPHTIRRPQHRQDLAEPLRKQLLLLLQPVQFVLEPLQPPFEPLQQKLEPLSPTTPVAIPNYESELVSQTIQSSLQIPALKHDLDHDMQHDDDRVMAQDVDQNMEQDFDQDMEQDFDQDMEQDVDQSMELDTAAETLCASNEFPLAKAESQEATDVDLDDYDEDYEYEADALLGGELEIQNYLNEEPAPGVDFVEMMDKSYQDSIQGSLAYQQDMLAQSGRHAFVSGHMTKPRIRLSAECATEYILPEVLEIIFNQVTEYTRALRPVDWVAVSREVFNLTGYRTDPHTCLMAFEDAIGEYDSEPVRCRSDRITLYNRTSMMGLLGMRERGGRQRHIIKDMLLLRQTRHYRCATSFNYSSGSVVDMALNDTTFKLAVANVATQDIYNRSGNLLLCDLRKGVTKTLHGHERQVQDEEQTFLERTVTVNDVKLSSSQSFFISGADDHKTMIWNAETGERVNVLEHAQSRVNRVAIMEEPMHHEDVFATCSEQGTIDIYSIDGEGQIVAQNKQNRVGSKASRRSISCISFGRGYFWDCLAAGVEGCDNGLETGAQGQVAFYDPNGCDAPVGTLNFRPARSLGTGKSVSCLSFSSSGNLVVCGTSGRSNGSDEETGDGLVRVLEVQHVKQVQWFKSGHMDVNLVDFSPCERFIISCSHDNEVAVFDRRFLKPEHPALHRFRHASKENHDDDAGISSAIWWPTSRGTSTQCMLLTGGGDGAVKLWDVRRATEDAEVWSLDANLGPIARMVSSASFEHVVVGGETGAVSVYTLDHGVISEYENRPMAQLSDDE